MQSSIPYYATPLILYHKTIYLSTERCTGIYGNNSGTIIGREVRIFSKLGPLVFVFAMAIRSMPMSANNGLILICGLCCIHAIEPSCSIPLLTVCFSPRRNIAVAFIPVRNAWYPAMRENITSQKGCSQKCVLPCDLKRKSTACTVPFQDTEGKAPVTLHLSV